MNGLPEVEEINSELNKDYYDSFYFKDLEKEWRSGIEKHNTKEFKKIFPEVAEVIRENILITIEQLDTANHNAYDSYLKSLKNPEIAYLYEVIGEMIFENIETLRRRLKRLVFQHLVLTTRQRESIKYNLDNIREHADLKAIAESYGLALRRSGKNYSCICPWHEDRNPSLVIFVDNNRFKCFGCERHGNVFNFIMEMEGVDFKTALNYLKKYV